MLSERTRAVEARSLAVPGARAPRLLVSREPLQMEGGTTFHFVTDGIESALEQARAAADGKELSLGGGASVAQQYLAAGLRRDPLSVVPLFLEADATLDELGDAS